MKRILQIAATSIAFLMVLAVAIPAFAASTCPTANTSPINDCMAKYKLTSRDISSIEEALRACGLNADVLKYGPVCETGDCTTPDCTKADCDGTECVTADCGQNVCGSTGSASDDQLNACTEADCANNGCDAADCATEGCKDNCATTKCVPAAEEAPAEDPDDTAAEAIAPTQTEDDTEVEAAATEEAGNPAIDEAIAEAKETVKNYASSSNCPTSDSTSEVKGVSVPKSTSSSCPTSGSSDVKSQLQDAVNKALDQAKSKASSGSSCPTNGSSNAQMQDAVNKALEQAKSYVSANSNCPTGGSVDVNSILNQLQNSGLSNCTR